MPILVARGIHKAGGEVCAIGLSDQYLPELINHCDYFKKVGVTRLGQWIKCLHRWHITEAVMAGGVAHTKKYHRFQFLHNIPDWRAAKLWYLKLRHDRRTGAVLTALAEELSKNGVHLIDNRKYIPDHLATVGLMTSKEVSRDIQQDIDFGWPLFLRTVELGIGQAMAVRGRDVIAIEAAEGTNAMITRAGELCGKRPWVFFKTCNNKHDMRADVPTIGVETVENLHKAGGCAMILGSQRVIMVDRPDVIIKANKLGITILGIDQYLVSNANAGRQPCEGCEGRPLI